MKTQILKLVSYFLINTFDNGPIEIYNLWAEQIQKLAYAN